MYKYSTCLSQGKIEASKMLTYKELLLYYNVPLLLLVLWITKPFLTRTDSFKVKIVSTVTVIATLAKNCLSNFRNRSYRQNAVTFIGGFVPAEALFNEILQIIISSLFTFCITRWSVILNVLRKPSPLQFHFTRYSVVCLLSLAKVLGWSSKSSEFKLVYGFFPIISCIWFVILI